MVKSELELLQEATSFIECVRLILGKNYYNNQIKNKVISYCFLKYNINILKVIEKNKNKNKKNEKYCLYCGKQIPTNKKFCNSSCSAKYNNYLRGSKSDEEKAKISETLHNYYMKLFDGKKVFDKESGKFKYQCKCQKCGKIFLSRKKDALFCSNDCNSSSELTKNKIRKKVYERMSNNTFTGWKTRNIKSYAEKFWETVLTNNDIKYVKEDFSTKKYFLDFLIVKNDKKIDLEIDGKQHNYLDRKLHDIERDEFLINNGFIVYRIQWNEINSEKGKMLMKEKINDFLTFYNNVN